MLVISSDDSEVIIFFLKCASPPHSLTRCTFAFFRYFLHTSCLPPRFSYRGARWVEPPWENCRLRRKISTFFRQVSEIVDDRAADLILALIIRCYHMYVSRHGEPKRNGNFENSSIART